MLSNICNWCASDNPNPFPDTELEDIKDPAEPFTAYPAEDVLREWDALSTLFLLILTDLSLVTV